VCSLSEELAALEFIATNVDRRTGLCTVFASDALLPEDLLSVLESVPVAEFLAIVDFRSIAVTDLVALDGYISRMRVLVQLQEL